MGDYFSAADITALCTVDFAAFAGLEMPEGTLHLTPGTRASRRGPVPLLEKDAAA